MHQVGEVDFGDETALLHEGLVPLRAVAGIRPHRVCRIFLVNKFMELLAIVRRSTGHRPFADQPMAPCRYMVLVAEFGDGQIDQLGAILLRFNLGMFHRSSQNRQVF